MGGSAFSLYTPRMPPPLYAAQKRRCRDLLLRLYHHVDSPIDGPAKSSFGDIDFFLFGPRSTTPESDTTTSDTTTIATPDNDTTTTTTTPENHHPAHQVAALLGAVAVIEAPCTTTSSNLAIPWPQDTSQETSQDDDDTPQIDKCRAAKYIQVDVSFPPTLDSFYWMLFRHAHADLWSILGTLIRPYGLTINHTGLHLRIPHLESLHKARAAVHLTSQPSLVLRFLHLPPDDPHRIWIDTPFADLDAMFSYIARCRFMYVGPTPPSPDNPDNDTKSSRDDRRRIRQRPVFRRWLTHFIPHCRAANLFTSPPPTSRADITREALATFGPAVAAEYRARQRAFHLDQQRAHIWNDIIQVQIPVAPAATSTLAEIQTRSCLVKALRRIILDRDDSYGVVFDEDMTDRYGDEDGDGHAIFYDEDKVAAFIDRHKDQVRDAALARHHAGLVRGRDKKIRSTATQMTSETDK